MNEHERLDEILNEKLAEANRSISAPPGLERRISRSIGRRVAVQRVGAGGSVLVLALAAAVVMRSMTTPATPASPGPLAHGDQSPPVEVQGTESPIEHHRATVRFADDSGFFAREIPTSRPNVSIVRVYRDLAAKAPTDDEPQIKEPGAAGPSSELTPLTQRSEV